MPVMRGCNAWVGQPAYKAFWDKLRPSRPGGRIQDQWV